MVITLAPDLEAALNQQAEKQNVSPEALAINALRQRFLPRTPVLEPRDEWERGLLAIATDCGVSPSNEDVSSEGLYD